MNWVSQKGPNVKAPKGINIPLEPSSSTFQKLSFLCKKQVHFQKEGKLWQERSLYGCFA